MLNKFLFGCHGRDVGGNEVLHDPVPAFLIFHQCGVKSIFEMRVECKYVTGGYAQRCFASHPEITDPEEHQKVLCPYVRSIGSPTGRTQNPPLIDRNY